MKESRNARGSSESTDHPEGTRLDSREDGQIYSANRLEVSEKGLPLQPASIERNALRSAPLTRFFEEV